MMKPFLKIIDFWRTFSMKPSRNVVATDQILSRDSFLAHHFSTTKAHSGHLHSMNLSNDNNRRDRLLAFQSLPWLGSTFGRDQGERNNKANFESMSFRDYLHFYQPFFIVLSTNVIYKRQTLFSQSIMFSLMTSLVRNTARRHCRAR